MAAHIEQEIQNSRFSRLKEYWCEKLLPIKNRKPIHWENKGIGQNRATTSLEFEFDAAIASEFQRITKGSPLLCYAVLVSAMQICVHIYTGEEWVSIGSPNQRVAGSIRRKQNLLAIMAQIQAGNSFRELLMSTRQTLVEAYEHQDYACERIAHDLGSHNAGCPVGDIVITLADFHEGVPDKGQHITITCTYEMGKVRGNLAFNSSVLSQGAVERLLLQWKSVIYAGLKNTAIHVGDLESVTDEERATILNHWSQSPEGLPTALVADLVETQAEWSADAIALVCGDEHVSYGALAQRSDELCALLLDNRVGPETVVGLYTEKSAEAVIAIVGIWKAGAAYVPLDPRWPQSRLEHAITKASPRVILCGKRSDVPAAVKSIVVPLRKIREDHPIKPVLRKPQVFPENLAYIIFTSGSTGEPKGVEVTLKGVANLAQRQIETFRVTQNSRVLQFAPLGFDASVSEILMVLLSGATLYIEDTNQFLAGPILASLLKKQAITHVTLPPSVLSTLPGESFPFMETVISAGEALFPEQVLGPKQCRWFINAYGPTESTVCASMGECRQDGRFPTIGRALGNMRIYVLDRNMQLVPAGVKGELYLGGVGVARGYVAKGGQTAERFVPDPFGESGERLYRTGDIGRWREDGELEYVGRNDEQVKVRGYRIELGEVEAVVRNSGLVKETAVVAEEYEQGQKRLMGFLVWESNAQGEGEGGRLEELRKYVGERLPSYMVPAKWRELENLPLTVNGKVDRARLMEEEKSREGKKEREDKNYVAPEGEVEEVLERIWAEVLRVKRVGVDENFFGLGGDSILSIQVVSRAQQAGWVITPQQVFLHPTVKQLAAVASAGHGIEYEQGVVSGEVSMTPIHGWWLEQKMVDMDHFNQSVLLQISGATGYGAWERVMEMILEHHDALRLRLKGAPEQWQMQIVEKEEHRITGAVDLRGLPEESWEKAIEATAQEVQRSLRLESGPVLRAIWIEGGEKGRRLFVVVHHATVDGFSWRILLEDIEQGCQQLLMGKSVKLTSKTSSFQRWAQQQRQRAQSAELLEQMEYWEEIIRKINGNERSFLAESKEEDREENIVEKAKILTVTLGEAETQALLQQAPKAARVSVEELLLTALTQILGEGRQGIWVDLEGHGRELEGVDVSRTVGWFTCLYPVWLPNETDELGRCLAGVKEELRRIPERGRGYGLLRYVRGEAEIAERLQIKKRPELLFNYLGQLDLVLPQKSLLQAAGEYVGASRSRRQARTHALEINAAVQNGQLQMNWTWAAGSRSSIPMEQLANDYISCLRDLIQYCLSTKVLYSPSDFPLAKIDQHQLERLSARTAQIVQEPGIN